MLKSTWLAVSKSKTSVKSTVYMLIMLSGTFQESKIGSCLYVAYSYELFIRLATDCKVDSVGKTTATTVGERQT